ncbi:unnamed protein product [Rangifer tarandus platyrhynchus]|uniref:Uncharacterized protein n=1 Tax=Rangifer tarandus platyrhynchus TaxID=3082113 RepID=A0AC60A1Q2_RANTA
MLPGGALNQEGLVSKRRLQQPPAVFSMVPLGLQRIVPPGTLTLVPRPVIDFTRRTRQVAELTPGNALKRASSDPVRVCAERYTPHVPPLRPSSDGGAVTLKSSRL